MRENGSDKNRILMIAPTPFFADRGCHVRILGEAKALMALGNPLTLCTYFLGRDVDGIPTERTVTIPWYKKLSPGPSYHKFYIDLLLLWKVLLVCRSFRPDIIHAHLHEGIAIGKIASRLFGIPMVADLQGSLTEELKDYGFIPKARWFLKLMNWLEKKINQMPHCLIASSTQTAQICVDHFGFSSHQVRPITDGVDLDVLSPQACDPKLRASLGIRPDDKVVVFIGVLTKHQGIDLLLDAIPLVVQKLPRAKFLIIGYPQEESYRQRARTLGIEDRTHFAGKIPYHETPRYLSLADIAVSPKISTTEANLKLFTYMAMGLPTVVFNNPVNREILGDLGIYARTADAKALAGALTGILNDQTRARRLGTQCRQKALKDYSWLTVGKRLMHIYNSVLAPPGHLLEAAEENVDHKIAGSL